MKIKLDENLASLGRDLLIAAGHEVSTVLEQQLSGAADAVLYEACRAAGQVLVTLDRDFGEVLRFPPEPTAGTAVIDCRGRPDTLGLGGRI
jgi:predicted nuclease of predicted toxin-antitoxin system